MPTTLISLPYDILLLVSELAFEAGLKDDVLGWSSTCKVTRAACLPVLFRNRTIVCKELTQDWQLPEHAGLRSYCRNLKADVSAACDGTDPPITTYFTKLVSLKVSFSYELLAGRQKLLDPAAWLAANFLQSQGAILQYLDLRQAGYWEPSQDAGDASDEEDANDRSTPTSRFYPLNLLSLPLPLLASLRRLEVIAPSAHTLIRASNAASGCFFPRLEIFITDCQELAATDVSKFLTQHQSIICLSLRSSSTLCLTHLINLVGDDLPNVERLQFIRVRGEARACACNSPWRIVELPRMKLLAIEDTDIGFDDDEETQHLATSMINDMGRLQARQLQYLYAHYAIRECQGIERVILFQQLADAERHPRFSRLFVVRKAPRDHDGEIDVEPYPWEYAETTGYAERFPGPLVPIRQ